MDKKKKKPIHSHIFRGKRYTIKPVVGRVDYSGLCDDPKTIDKTLRIPVHGKTQYDLATIIHESTHACFWDIDEEAVDEFAVTTARLLSRLGWKKDE